LLDYDRQGDHGGSMRDIFYGAESKFLENYLNDRATASIADLKAATDLWGNPIPDPGTDAAINEIYRVDGDTAHIKIEGPLSPDGPDAWDRFWGYGGASYKTIQVAMDKAKNDSMIARVIFDVDSPGGSLSDCDETWQKHKNLAAVKPTEVHFGNMLASAAYYICAPAKKILGSSPASEAGSIGVLLATYDWSGWEEENGIKKVVITSSNAPDKYPDVATEQGKDTIRARLDAFERIFYSRVAEGRGVTPEYIAEHFGHGGLLVARDPSTDHEDAIRSGMIDGLTTDTVDTDSVETEDTPQVRLKREAETITANILRAIANGAESVTVRLASGQPPIENKKDEINAFLSENYSSLEGNNTPAPAGTTQEGHMELSELLKANPAAAAEYEKAKAEAKAAGAEEARAELSARVDKVLPIIQSGAYPVNIKVLACNALGGKEDMVAFTTAVTLFDSNGEKNANDAAIAQTQELGPVTGEAPSGKLAADKEIDAALQAELDRRKAN